MRILPASQRGFCVALPVKARRAKARERLPSCCEPASRNPTGRMVGSFLRDPSTRAPVRLLSIRAPASGGATDFFLASALSNHHPALRPKGEEGARCVQPTSATQSNCVHPHLVRSRFAPPLSQRGGLTETKAPCGTTGDRTFHDVRDRFGGSSCERGILILLPDGRAMSVGVFFPRRRCDRASDTPVTLHRSPSASPTFVGAATWPHVLRWKGWYGSEDAEERQDHRGRRLVKADAS
jgi:hypothetical protein